MKHIGSTITSLKKCSDEIRNKVVAARQENAPVLDEAKVLLTEKRDLETKNDLLFAFNQHFIISDADIGVLMSTAEAVDERFFSVLARVKRVHSDCQLLLGSENQRLGLELMEQSSRNLNVGYQKLYRWIQKEFLSLNLENPQINSLIRKAVRTLAERPTLFQSCLDVFSEARERVLTDGFYSALTGSSIARDQDRMAKPIEFHAHDPIRYIGDILAWVHSATVSEREALESLFISEGEEMARGVQVGRQMEPWSSVDAETFDGQKALSDLVHRNFTGVARALRQRVGQAIQNQEDAVLTYKIANLFGFYQTTFKRLLGADSSVMEALTALEDSALRHFQTIMSDFIAMVQTDIDKPAPDLRVPGFLEETLSQLSELTRNYESSLSPITSRQEGFQPILNQTLLPILERCEALAKEVDEPARSIFLCNCYLASQSTLQPYSFTEKQTAQLAASLESCTLSLAEYQHAFFLHTSGLHPLLAALTSLPDSPASLLQIPRLPAFQVSALTEASQVLDDFLPSALMDATENLERLSNAKLAGDITTEGADRFCEDFEFVEGKLAAVDELREEGEGIVDTDGEGDDVDGRDGVVPLRSLFPRTSGEIRVLLS